MSRFLVLCVLKKCCFRNTKHVDRNVFEFCETRRRFCLHSRRQFAVDTLRISAYAQKAGYRWAALEMRASVALNTAFACAYASWPLAKCGRSPSSSARARARSPARPPASWSADSTRDEPSDMAAARFCRRISHCCRRRSQQAGKTNSERASARMRTAAAA